MSNLNAWQKIDRVLPKKPFGDGINGSATISSDPNTRATIIGTAGSPNATAGSTAFANGDLVLLHQTRGSGAGQWEINRVLSGGGTTSLVLEKNNQYTYVAGAQIIKIPRYSTATINAHSVTAWNGSTGGIEVICAKSTIVSGQININGKGFAGGVSNIINNWNYSGEGTGGASSLNGGVSNGNGGGGGKDAVTTRPGGGAGGGNSTNGANGISGDGGGGGTFGQQSGTSDLINITFGGAGGAGGAQNDGSWHLGGNGGNSGGILIIISKKIELTSQIQINGLIGGNATTKAGGGGAGAGGSCLLVGDEVILGTNNISVSNSSGGSGNDGGGAGGSSSTGRIAIHYKTSVTGTSTPASTNTQDSSLREGTFGLIY